MPASNGPRAVTDAAARDLVVLDFDDEVVAERNVRLLAAVAAPSAGFGAGRAAGKARRSLVRPQALEQRGFLFLGKRAAKAHVVEQTRGVVEAQ